MLVLITNDETRNAVSLDRFPSRKYDKWRNNKHYLRETLGKREYIRQEPYREISTG